MSLEIEFERTYTVPFYPKLNTTPRGKRAPRAMRIIKEFVKRHMKVDDENIWIDDQVNEFIWKKGIQKPPRKVMLRLVKIVDGVVEVFLAETQVKETKKPVIKGISKPSETELEEDEEEEEEE